MSEPRSDATDTVCARCASEDDDLTPVWAEAEEPELWCAECRARYPHEPADDEEEAEDDA